MTDNPNDREREERQDHEAAEAKAAGPEAELAYLKARCEAGEKEIEAEQKRLEAGSRIVFSLKVNLYKGTAKLITVLGYERTLTVLADPAEDDCGDLEISAEDHRQMMEQNRDLATAIDQGMSLREYLEFDSVRSWLDRERSNDADSNTGAEPE